MKVSVKDPGSSSLTDIASPHLKVDQTSVLMDAHYPLRSQNSHRHDHPEMSKLSEAGMMHDLGNLLQVIASANRIIERSVGRQHYDDLEWLARSSGLAIERATELRQRILGSPVPGLGREFTSLDASISAISEMIVVAAGPGIDVHFVTCSDAPVVRCDRRELENAVLNLVTNARDAMPQGGVLTVSLGKQPVGQREGADGGIDRVDAFLSVSDTGQGMAPEVIKAAFDAFFTTKVDGHGLGLAMVDAFARSTGGSVAIDSAIGRGSTITLRLPGRSGHPLPMPRHLFSNQKVIDC